MGKKARNIVDRFWGKVDRRGDNDCWEWKANINNSGYGQIRTKFGASNEFAHRLSYMLFKGDIPTGMQIDHLCKNRLCVNPNHLEAVTPHINNLRSSSVPAINARKSCCPCGRDYDKFYVYGTEVHRRCSVCDKEYNRLYRIKDHKAGCETCGKDEE